MSTVEGIDFVKLRQNMTKSFSLSELEELCYDLRIEAGNIPGPELGLKVIQIIEYCQRRGPQLFDLIAYCESERPSIQWRQPIQAQVVTMATLDQRVAHRQELYKKSKEVQMVHAMVPSQHVEGYWDILIYLVQHQSQKLTEVAYAEFFLGRYWENKIFKAVNQGNFVGILISAYGPTLCTCRVVFTDGQETMLERYIDLEMIHFFPHTKETSPEAANLPPRINSQRLAELIAKNFNQGELSLLTIDLVGFETVPEEEVYSEASSARQLVTYIENQNRLSELMALCQQERPNIQWAEAVTE